MLVEALARRDDGAIARVARRPHDEFMFVRRQAQLLCGIAGRLAVDEQFGVRRLGEQIDRREFGRELHGDARDFVGPGTSAGLARRIAGLHHSDPMFTVRRHRHLDRRLAAESAIHRDRRARRIGHHLQNAIGLRERDVGDVHRLAGDDVDSPRPRLAGFHRYRHAPPAVDQFAGVGREPQRLPVDADGRARRLGPEREVGPGRPQCRVQGFLEPLAAHLDRRGEGQVTLGTDFHGPRTGFDFLDRAGHGAGGLPVDANFRGGDRRHVHGQPARQRRQHQPLGLQRVMRDGDGRRQRFVARGGGAHTMFARRQQPMAADARDEPAGNVEPGIGRFGCDAHRAREQQIADDEGGDGESRGERERHPGEGGELEPVQRARRPERSGFDVARIAGVVSRRGSAGHGVGDLDSVRSRQNCTGSVQRTLIGGGGAAGSTANSTRTSR